MGQNTKRRLRLFQASPLCHWCRRETSLDAVPGEFSHRLLATVDHLIDRPTAQRQGMSSAERNRHVVLACHECNQRRNRIALAGHRTLPGWGQTKVRLV